MKVRNLPLAGSKVKLTFKENINSPDLIGVIYSAYPMPIGHYGARDCWRVAFLVDGDDVGRMKSFSVRSIQSCKVIE